MKVLAFDTETSGLPNFALPADHPSQPRICAIAGILFDPAGDPAEDREAHQLIKPEGWSIDPGAQRVHGLSVEHLTEKGHPIAEVLPDFLVWYDEAEEITGYNVAFDLKLLRGELRRAGLPDRYGAKPDRCMQFSSSDACRLAPTDKMMAAGYKKNKPPKLIEAVQILLGERMQGAHNALVDIRWTVKIYRHLFKRNMLADAKIRIPTRGPATSIDL